MVETTPELIFVATSAVGLMLIRVMASVLILTAPVKVAEAVRQRGETRRDDRRR
ncbi:MAG: hypothetical protein AB1671_22020 [Thermodesulfobacteriota bacterium]|jgi:hypothetical protein